MIVSEVLRRNSRHLLVQVTGLPSPHLFAGAIAIYDYIVKRFGSATESPLREQVAAATSARDCLRIS